MKKGSLITFVVVLAFISGSISIASDVPIKSITEYKGSLAACKAFIKNEAKKLTPEFKCRSLLDVVYVCDNKLFHAEFSCNDGEASLEVFEQDGTDWERFYK